MSSLSLQRYPSPPASLTNTALASIVFCARLRWCVSGTPIFRGGSQLSDLQGILGILNHDPFRDSALWRQAVIQPLNHGGVCPHPLSPLPRAAVRSKETKRLSVPVWLYRATRNCGRNGVFCEFLWQVWVYHGLLSIRAIEVPFRHTRGQFFRKTRSWKPPTLLTILVVVSFKTR
jgi:SNF2-related domain